MSRGSREKSLHSAAYSQSPPKFVSLAAVCCCEDLLRIFTTNLCFLSTSQVYGLFEGMLEKLELDDDGECYGTFKAISPLI